VADKSNEIVAIPALLDTRWAQSRRPATRSATSLAGVLGAVRTRTPAKRERSGATEPLRHVMVRQACFGPYLRRAA
jgi:hypothetical protein